MSEQTAGLGASNEVGDELIAAARELAPTIRDYADEVERSRSLPAPLFQALKERGLFRLWLPKIIGGYEIDALTLMRVVQELARLDASVGWCVMVAAQSGIVLGRFEEEGIRKTLTPDDIVAGSITRGGRADVVPGGYRISGRWPFASGSMHSTWFYGNCAVFQDGKPRQPEGGATEIRLILFPASACKVLDSWYTTGMQGTGSNDFEVSDVFVPDALVSRLGHAQRRGWGGPQYEPQASFVYPPRGAMALGIARHALDCFIEIAQKKKYFGTTELLKDTQHVQAAVGKAEAELAAAELYVYATIGELWDAAVAGGPFPEELTARARLALTHTAEVCLGVVANLYRIAGATAIYRLSPLERAFRDMNTMMADQGISPRLIEAAGRVYLKHGEPAGI